MMAEIALAAHEKLNFYVFDSNVFYEHSYAVTLAEPMIVLPANSLIYSPISSALL